ncbi:hypothetical protein FRC02_003858 [Tulasnella sp. 418]|nr:hypothetical protein FRC02_003858 [Tulasnella sp. 418]
MPPLIGIVPTFIVLQLYSSAQIPTGVPGRYTSPPTSQQISLSQPVFARGAGYSDQPTLIHTTQENTCSTHDGAATEKNQADMLLQYPFPDVNRLKAEVV